MLVYYSQMFILKKGNNYLKCKDKLSFGACVVGELKRKTEPKKKKNHKKIFDFFTV